MKTSLAFVVLVLFHLGYSQEKQIREIDKIVGKIKANNNFCTAGVNDTIIGEDSAVVGSFNFIYCYSNSKKKKLIKVNQLLHLYGDTSLTNYYFSNKSLIKVEVHRTIHGSLHVQIYYFKDGRLVYSNLKSDLMLTPQTYLDNAKALLVGSKIVNHYPKLN
jgi:hypothetical protein